MATIRSVNVGRLVPTEHTSAKTRATGIAKAPVTSIEVRDPGPKKGGLGSGVVGDELGDHRHHGGSDQAVYAVAREELDWWAGELGRELPDGCFGENLTTQGLDVDAAIVGTQWRIGSALLEVTGPRIPCRTFAGHLGERGWVKRFSARGRTGAYLRVVEPGRIAAGDAVEVVSVPEHGFTVPDAFRALMGDRELAEATSRQAPERISCVPSWPADPPTPPIRGKTAGGNARSRVESWVSAAVSRPGGRGRFGA